MGMFTKTAIIGQNQLSLAFQKTTVEMLKYEAGLVRPLQKQDALIAGQKKLAFEMQLTGQMIQMVTTSLMGMAMAGIAMGAADSPIMMFVTALNAAFMALNTTIMINNALLAAGKAALNPYAAAAIFTGSLAVSAGIAAAFRASRNNQMAEMNTPVADTGMVSNRHQLVYVEPGEQIISKTQGMVGMGSGITVNVGDVYTRDGTDFAQKLADELPRALRMTSYRGSF